LSEGEEAALDGICEHISGTERTSMEAERNATDRFTAAYLSEKIGAEFAGRISGVTRFGLFVTLHESGADGLVPMKSLSNDFYVHDEHAHALIGRRKKIVFRLGGEVTVKLKEADGLTGSTVLELSAERLRYGADIRGMEKPKGGCPGRGAPAKFNRKSSRKGPKSNSSEKSDGRPPKKIKKKTTPKHKRKKKSDN
jgi:ribonuclease R